MIMEGFLRKRIESLETDFRNVPKTVVSKDNPSPDAPDGTIWFKYQANPWSVLADCPISMYGAACAVYNDRYLYVFGGRAKNESGSYVETNNFMVYDSVENVWNMLEGEHPEAESFYGFIYNNKFFIIGATRKKMYYWDIANGGWTDLGEIPLGYFSLASTYKNAHVFGDNVKVIRSSTSAILLGTIPIAEETPLTDATYLTLELPWLENYSVTKYSETELLLVGGRDASNVYNRNCYKINVDTGEATLLGVLPIGFSLSGITTDGQNAYVYSGHSSKTAAPLSGSNKLWKFNYDNNIINQISINDIDSDIVNDSYGKGRPVMAIIDNKLIIVGGFYGDVTENSTEVSNKAFAYDLSLEV